jgi:hypothetical protein
MPIRGNSRQSERARTGRDGRHSGGDARDGRRPQAFGPACQRRHGRAPVRGSSTALRERHALREACRKASTSPRSSAVSVISRALRACASAASARALSASLSVLSFSIAARCSRARSSAAASRAAASLRSALSSAISRSSVERSCGEMRGGRAVVSTCKGRARRSRGAASSAHHSAPLGTSLLRVASSAHRSAPFGTSPPRVASPFRARWPPRRRSCPP